MYRASEVKDLTLEEAVELLSWPRLLGNHDSLHDPVVQHRGKYGYYVQVGQTKATIPKVRRS